MFALSKAPAIDRQCNPPFLVADWRVGGLGLDPLQKLLFAEIVHAPMPMNEDQSWSGCLTFVRAHKDSGYRLKAVQIEHQPLQRVAFARFTIQQCCWPWLV